MRSPAARWVGEAYTSLGPRSLFLRASCLRSSALWVIDGRPPLTASRFAMRPVFILRILVDFLPTHSTQQRQFFRLRRAVPSNPGSFAIWSRSAKPYPSSSGPAAAVRPGSLSKYT